MEVLHIDSSQLDSKLATNSPVTSCGSLADLDGDRWFTCNICLVSCPVDDSLIDKVCSNACPATMCSSCMLDYIVCRNGDALPGVLTKLLCPICLIPVNMTRWKRRLRLPHFDLVLTDLEQKILKSCELKCPWCHANNIELPPTQESVPTIKMFPDMVSKIPELRRMCRFYCHHELSVSELVDYVQSTFGSPLGGVILDNMLPLIHDTERRASLYLRLRRMNPFIYTRCCKAPVCFSCHVTGHHEGESCADQNAMTNTEIIECFQCGLALVKGDGCDSVQCYCGHQFDWVLAVRDAKMRQLGTRHLQALRNMLPHFRLLIKRRRVSRLIVAGIPLSCLILRRKTNERMLKTNPNLSRCLRLCILRWTHRIRQRQVLEELIEYTTFSALKIACS